VDSFGRLDSDRTREDLLQFDAVHRRTSEPNAYIALWLVDGDQHCVQREAFGHAYYDGERLKGRFINSNEQDTMMVGGFYVLARSRLDGQNPFAFVTVRELRVNEDTYPAKITSWQRNEAWFGTVDMARNVAGGVDYRQQVHKIDGPSDPGFFNNFVYILMKRDDEQQQQPLIGGHRPVVVDDSYGSQPREYLAADQDEQQRSEEAVEGNKQQPDQNEKEENRKPLDVEVQDPEAAIEQEAETADAEPDNAHDA